MATSEPLAWMQVGTTDDDCLRELLDLYWEALEREIEDAILSLNNILLLQKTHPDAGIGPQDLSHRVPARLGPPILAWNPLELDWQQQMDCVTEAGELAWEQQNVDDDYLMARMMLSGLSMLDVDEIMEYRDPPLPSQSGPPRCQAVKNSTGDAVEILLLSCDICDKPLRGLAWICRLGCRSNVGTNHPTTDSFHVCMKCYSGGKHPRQHLVRSPHRYAIPKALQEELDLEAFWLLRRKIQRKQDELDLELDRSVGGIINSTVTRALTPWSRNIFPLGNVHTAVTFGPLIFEIGVRDSKGGARISCRRPPRLGKTWSNTRCETVLALDRSRILYKASGRIPQRTIQATVKQVVGGMFSGYHQHLKPLEDYVVKMLYAAAVKWTEKPLKSRQANYVALRRHAHAVIEPFRLIMEGYLIPYLKAITNVLFDRGTELRWGQYTNNCQNFCDAIIQQSVFSTVFPSSGQLYSLRTDRSARLDYVLSFRTEPQLGTALESSRLSIGPLSAFLKLLHRQTNVLDYQETQGRCHADDTPLCAEIFAWRCHDQDCDLADHIWINPAEFVSLLQFHLMLDKSHYLQNSKTGDGNAAPLDELQWAKNRIAILQANDSFATSAAAIARTFQNRLQGHDSRTWNPPKPPSIPQDVPFMMDGDELQYAQEDPGPGRSFFGEWVSRANRNEPAVELPKAYGPNATAAVVIPTPGPAAAFSHRDDEIV